jgi:hypothetical protein
MLREHVNKLIRLNYYLPSVGNACTDVGVFGTKPVLLIIFYNDTSVIIKMLIYSL